VDDVMFSHSEAHRVVRWGDSGYFTSALSPRAWAMSTRSQLTTNDLNGWRGGRRHFETSAKSAIYHLLVIMQYTCRNVVRCTTDESRSSVCYGVRSWIPARQPPSILYLCRCAAVLSF